MTVEQRPSQGHASAATVHQVLVARGLTMRDMDHGQSATDRNAGHCGFLFPEYESYVDHCEHQWANYMAQWLPRRLESAVTAASNVSEPEHDASRAADEGETARLPLDPRQGDLYV
jgi:hypothetical protein